MFGLFRKKKKVKHVEKIVEPKKQEFKEEEKEVEAPVEEVKEEPLKEVEKPIVETKEEPEKKVTKKKAVNHITKHSQGGWQIKKSGSNRALKRFKTQKEAIEYAKHLEESTDTGYVIHKADGGIRKKTY